MKAPITAAAPRPGSQDTSSPYRISLTVPAAAISEFSGALEDYSNLSAFEIEDGGDWLVEIYTEGPPDIGELSMRLALTARASGVAEPVPEITPVAQRDWVADTFAAFPPIRVERFFIHGSHVTDKPPASSIGLLVDAATAFGSGEHPTTAGCLTALAQLARRRTFNAMLDMGCGSGILAVAMAKLWPGRIMAADIDAQSVRITAQNAEINRVAGQVTVCRSDGYAHAPVRARSPYDLIVANILARPLTAMAKDAASVLADDGILVLSGLMTRQEPSVLWAHRLQGLSLVRRYRIGVWSTLVLSRAATRHPG